MDKQILSQLSPKELLQKADAFLRQDEHGLAYVCYCAVLDSHPENKHAWLRRAQTARSPMERKTCLEKLATLEERQPTYRYETLDILIGGEHKEGYEARVLSSPVGEKKAFIHLYPKSDLFQVKLQQLDLDIVDDALLMSLGSEFFKALFTEGLGDDVYRESLAQAVKKNRDLRLLLRIEPHELACLPWELLYDVKEQEFLGVSLHVHFIRYPQVMQPMRDFEMALPIKLLVIISNPRDMQPLDIVHEKSLIEQAVERIQQNSGEANCAPIQVEFVTRPSRSAIKSKLSKNFHIVHFIGHGNFAAEGASLVLTKEDGAADPISAREVAELFEMCDSVRLVVLNSCESAKTLMNESFLSVAEALVNHGVPCVVAMQYSVYDSDAVTFSEEFYRTLIEPNYIDIAIQRARRSLMLGKAESKRSWVNPILLMRSSDGMIINFMTLSQTEIYLGRKGLLNAYDLEKVYEITQGHPILIRLIADLWMNQDEESRRSFVKDQLAPCLGKPESEKIAYLYDKLRAKIPDKSVRKVLEYGPVIGLISRETLAKALNIQDTTEIVARLGDFSLLKEEAPGELRFPKLVQELQIAHIKSANPGLFKKITRRMADYCAQRVQEAQELSERKKWTSEAIRYQFLLDEERAIALWRERIKEAENRGDLATLRELLNEVHTRERGTLSPTGKAVLYDLEGDYWESKRELGKANGYYLFAQNLYGKLTMSEWLLTELRNELRRYILFHKPELGHLLKKAEAKAREGSTFVATSPASADLEHARQAFEASMQMYNKLGGVISIIRRTLGFFRGNIQLRSDPRFLHGLAIVKEMLGVISHSQGKWNRAMKFYEAAFKIYRRLANEQRCQSLQQLMKYVRIGHIPHFIFNYTDLEKWPDLTWIDRLAP